jgi:hypothetical protein
MYQYGHGHKMQQSDILQQQWAKAVLYDVSFGSIVKYVIW